MDDFWDDPMNPYGLGIGGSAMGQAPDAAEETTGIDEDEEMRRRLEEEQQALQRQFEMQAEQIQLPQFAEDPTLDPVDWRYGRPRGLTGEGNQGVISSGHMGQYLGNTQRVAPQLFGNDPYAGLVYRPGGGGSGPGDFGVRLADEYQSGRMTQADVYDALSPAASAEYWDAHNQMPPADPNFTGPPTPPPVRDPARPATDYLPGSGIEYQALDRMSAASQVPEGFERRFTDQQQRRLHSLAEQQSKADEALATGSISRPAHQQMSAKLAATRSAIQPQLLPKTASQFPEGQGQGQTWVQQHQGFGPIVFTRDATGNVKQLVGPDKSLEAMEAKKQADVMKQYDAAVKALTTKTELGAEVKPGREAIKKYMQERQDLANELMGKRGPEAAPVQGTSQGLAQGAPPVRGVAGGGTTGAPGVQTQAPQAAVPQQAQQPSKEEAQKQYDALQQKVKSEKRKLTLEESKEMVRLAAILGLK